MANAEKKNRFCLVRKAAAGALAALMLAASMVIAPVAFAIPGESLHTADTFRDLPGITEEEIAAVEHALSSRAAISYGMLESSRCFYREDGSVGGFSQLFCERLSTFFGVPFNLQVYEGDQLDKLLRAGEIDFSGEFMIGSEADGLVVSETIGERALQTVRLLHSTSLEDIARERPVQYGLRGKSGVAAKALEDNPPGYNYDVVLVSDGNEAIEMLRDGKLDIFMADATFIDGFKVCADVEIKPFDPLTFKSVGMASKHQELAPLISAVNRYLADGGLAELNEFYTEGDLDFSQQTFLSSLTEEERAWYDEHIKNELQIPIAVSGANYPVNFYNEKEGMYDGIAMDVLSDIKKITGLRFEIVNAPGAEWPEVFELLTSGQAAMTMELLRTDERVGKYIFGANPYTEDNYVLISRSDTPSISINQVLYANTALVENTGYANMFRAWFPDNASTKTYTNIYDAFDALEKGDVDFLMATENRLLAMTNYRENSGFKTNLIFDYSSASQFGYNLEETILPGIMDKAQGLVDTVGIDNRWKHMTFDYQKQAAQRQTWYMIGICALLAFVIMLMFVLMRHRREQQVQLEALVEERTAELAEQTRATEAANNAKSDFLANMSHEMRTPLNAVIGLSELTLTQDYSPEETQSNLEKIYNSGVTMLGLVNDILDLSKIESGKFELVPVDYDIPSLINDTVTLNIIRIGSKPIEFRLDMDGELPARLFGDELRVKQIFNNLLSNAFKYTKEGSVVWSMRCERDEADPKKMWLIGEVRDTGIGIKPENLGTVFGEYSQVDTKKNRKIEGTGLGLAITKSMVEMMGGHIEVESVYGEGSTFRVTLAQEWLTDEKIGAQVIENLKAFRYADRKRDRNASFVRAFIPYAKVLVVDDVATNLDVARGLFKPYGMKVDTATSGKAAIELIRKNAGEYNAVFMDHMMPEMDGIEATHIIKNEIGTEYAKNLPIIALTANAIIGNDEMFLSNGFQDFLSKPIDIMKLDDVINRWVRDKQLEKELAAKGEVVGDRDGMDAETQMNSGLFDGKQVQGVDLADGLSRFGGDEQAYLDVVRSYVKNTPELADKSAGVTRETLADYAITVHGIKGASRNIGARTLGSRAEELELAAKAEDFAYVSQNNEAFLGKVRRVIADLGKMLADIDAAQQRETKPAPDADTLAALLEAARTFDVDAADEAMAALESYRYECGEELVAWLREELNHAGFAKIVGKLEQELKEIA